MVLPSRNSPKVLGKGATTIFFKSFGEWTDWTQIWFPNVLRKMLITMKQAKQGIAGKSHLLVFLPPSIDPERGMPQISVLLKNPSYSSATSLYHKPIARKWEVKKMWSISKTALFPSQCHFFSLSPPPFSFYFFLNTLQ